MPFWKRTSGSVEWLADVAFFDGFSETELHRVADLGEETEAVTGAEITDQGSVGQVCYVIVDGSASVYVGSEHIATLEAGSMVGELALLDRRPRNATVIADSAMKLLAFDVAQFDTLLGEFPVARGRVMTMLTERARPRSE